MTMVCKWHYGENEGSEQAEIIVFYAGEKDEPITIKRQENESPHSKEPKATQ